MRALSLAGFLAWLALTSRAPAGDGNRLAYLDEVNPYYPHRDFARLTTPQWVGEPGVEAAVILAIDDMRDPAKYEAFLRPILDRLKQIDGRAPLSIMTNRVDPQDPQLQKWLQEGVSIECHTLDHPCPLLTEGDFAKAKATYDGCVDLIARIPLDPAGKFSLPTLGGRGNAFRMPCCDSLNTVSPRFFAEIMAKETAAGHRLSIDSSVFNILTPNDPALPRELVYEPGTTRERFRKYLPFPSFVNTIEDYPYPYLIGGNCWEFPCVVPSDWEAQNIQQPNNPRTVEDLKAALDAVVVKQGVFCFVFHPHGWIRAEQVVELIDHAVARHGGRVKFLSFLDAKNKLQDNLAIGSATNVEWRSNYAVDLNADGYMDVVSVDATNRVTTRTWQHGNGGWNEQRVELPIGRVRWGVLDASGSASAVVCSSGRVFVVRFGDQNPVPQVCRLTGDLPPNWTTDQILRLREAIHDVFLRDIDGDGRCELLLLLESGSPPAILTLDAKNELHPLPFTLPPETAIVDAQGRDAGLRFVDIDEDGDLDVLFSNEARFSLHLFESLEKGWSREVLRGKPGDARTIPPMVRNGTNNGAWFHSRHLWVQNEDTARLPDLVDRRSFHELLGNTESGPRSPEASRRSIRVRSGLQVELVAAEPLVMDPIGVDWGADGKLWVVEMGDYPLGADNMGAPGGRVRYLEDTDGDGRYDRSTLFLDKLSYPTGVMAWGRGVLVSTAPEVFYAEDVDLDGRADKREPLITGFGEANPQHRVNGFCWGLDNWVHCAIGESGGEIRSVKTGKSIALGGRDFRFRPTTGEIDPQTGSTQYQRVQDDWGNWFGSDNIHPLWHFALADEYLRRNPHVAATQVIREVPELPGSQPVFPISRTLARFNDFHQTNHITSACGVGFYRDDLLGADLAGNAFICEPVHNLIHREVVSQDGASFRSRRAEEERASEFLASTDNWFRPVMVRTGPDGALWIADMYRQVLEHPEWIPDDWEAKLDLRAGHDRGRIYRIVPAAGKLRDVPRVATLPTPELVAQLESPNGTLRDMAQRTLVAHRDETFVTPSLPALRRLARGGQLPARRLQALCTLDGLHSLDEDTVVAALADAHPGVRRHALRLSERFLKDDSSVAKDVLDERWFTTRGDASVKLQYACTVGALPDAQAAVPLAAMLIAEWEDRYMRSAVLSSITRENLPLCAVVVCEAELKNGLPPELLGALADLALAFDDRVTCGELLDRALRPDQLSLPAAVLAALGERGVTPGALYPNDPSAAQGVEDALSKLREAAARSLADDQSPIETRLAALEIVAQDETAAGLELIESLLTPSAPVELRDAAIDALAEMDADDARKALFAAWKSFTPQVRNRVLDALLRRAGRADVLLAAVEAGDIAASDFDADRRQRLAMRAGPELRDRVLKALAAEVETDRRRVVDEYRDVLALQADAEHGAEVFRAKCSVCHQLGNVGYPIGADLAALTDKSPEAQLVAILDPNRAMESKFASYTALATDGLTYTGMLVEETGASITLLAQEDKRYVIPRSSLEQCETSGKSLMPEGLEKDLSRQDLADVMAYVAKLPTPRKEFPGNQPAVVRADDQGAVKLTAATAEIHGRTLVYEGPHQNLGFWGSEDDRAVWTADVQQPGRYQVFLHYACHDDTAGNRFVVQAGEQRLTGEVAGTGTWDYYRRVPIGELELAAGEQRISLRSDGPIAGHLMDLFELSLEK